jgi:hypothetical protein
MANQYSNQDNKKPQTGQPQQGQGQPHQQSPGQHQQSQPQQGGKSQQGGGSGDRMTQGGKDDSLQNNQSSQKR